MPEIAKKISVVIVEDHELMRDGIRSSIEADQRFEVVGEAADGEEAVELVNRLCPDVVIMDIGLPKLDGIEATRKLNELVPQVKVIMLTSHRSENEVFASFCSGASGYCLKESASKLLKTALASVADGAIWFDPHIAGFVVEAFSVAGRGVGKDLSVDNPLSEREVDVVKLVAEGMSNKEIASALTISTATVRTHVEHILEKLAVSGRTQAAVEAIRRNLV